LKNNIQTALNDYIDVYKKFSIAYVLGIKDIKQKYRRSFLGAFWITITTLFMIALIGYVYSTVLTVDFNSYLIYLTVSIILWTFISGFITDSCNSFIDSADIISQIKLPYTSYVMKNLVKHVVILLHNFILIFICLFFIDGSLLHLFFFLFSFFLVCISLFNIGIILAFLSLRFRDFPIIVNNLIFALFLCTPIFWKIEMMPNRISLVSLNPVYNIIEMIRAPLLGAFPPLAVIIYFFIFLILLSASSFLIFVKFRKKIPYWI